jgi:hypothetical protein
MMYRSLSGSGFWFFSGIIFQPICHVNITDSPGESPQPDIAPHLHFGFNHSVRLGYGDHRWLDQIRRKRMGIRERVWALS